MPILHAALKSMKVTKKKTARNQIVKSKIKTETRKFIDLLSSKKPDEAKKQLNVLMSALDKASSKGIIHKKTASRRKSRLMKKMQKAKS